MLHSQKPYFMASAVLLFSVVNAVLINPPYFTLGLQVYLHDIAFLIIFFLAMVRFVFLSEYRNSSILWVLYGCILFAGIVIGIKQNGTLAGVDFRNFFYFWSGTFCFMTFSYSDKVIERLISRWVFIALILLAFVYFRFLAEFLGLPMAMKWINADVTGVPFRVINSSQTFLLGVAVVLMTHRMVILQSRPSTVLLVLFVAAVVTLQHRSVWAATACGLMAIYLYPGIKKGVYSLRLGSFAIVGGVLLMPFLFFGLLDSFTSSISDSAIKATDLSTGTFGARVDGWLSIIDYWSQLGFFSQLIGEPFGSGYAGSETSPHNFFFHSLLRAGLFGNFLVFSFYIVVMYRLFFVKTFKRGYLHSPLLFSLLAFQLVYYIPYSPQPEHGIILGIAASLAFRKKAADKKLLRTEKVEV